MIEQAQRFRYPFTATTVIARRLVPLLLFTLGIGLFAWAGREYYYWLRPWAVLPPAALGLLTWLVALHFATLLPEVRADGQGLRVRRWGLFWRRIPWEAVATVQETAYVDLLGWVESLYTVYAWRPLIGRRGHIRRDWHRRRVPVCRFSGHIRNGPSLLALIEERAEEDQASSEGRLEAKSPPPE